MGEFPKLIIKDVRISDDYVKICAVCGDGFPRVLYYLETDKSDFWACGRCALGTALIFKFNGSVALLDVSDALTKLRAEFDFIK